MKLSVFLLSASILALTACSPQKNGSITNLNNQSGIIGGTAAEPTDIVTPSTVSLMINYRGGPYSFCTGTLISKNLVLTATHCLRDLPSSAIHVFFGDKLPTTFEDPNVVKLKSLAMHPDYKMGRSQVSNTYTGFHDIALVLLEKDAPVTARPVPVLNDTVLKDRQSVLLAGYGLLQDIPYTVSAKGLHYTRVEIAKTFENLLVTDQRKAQGACSGDSGGPAYLETEQGLIVLGITRGPHAMSSDCRQYGEYTYASRYKDFILLKAAELGAEPPVFVDAPTEL